MFRKQWTMWMGPCEVLELWTKLVVHYEQLLVEACTALMETSINASGTMSNVDATDFFRLQNPWNPKQIGQNLSVK